MSLIFHQTTYESHIPLSMSYPSLLEVCFSKQKQSLWCLTDDSCSERRHTMCCGSAVVVFRVSVFCWREQRKTCAHMWVLCRGRALALYCFQQMGVEGDEGGCCMCVGGTAGVCSSSVCLRVKSLFILAVSRMSAKMTGHAPVYTHTHT